MQQYIFQILYYYNKNEVDSVSKLVNYVKPIAERMEFSGCTSMHKIAYLYLYI